MYLNATHQRETGQAQRVLSAFMQLRQRGRHEFKHPNGFINGSSLGEVTLNTVQLVLDRSKLMASAEVEYSNYDVLQITQQLYQDARFQILSS